MRQTSDNAVGQNDMVSTIEVAFESLGTAIPSVDKVSSGGYATRSQDAGMRCGRGWARRLDRISSDMCENAVGLHWREHEQYRREHRQLVRRAAALHLWEKLADLKEQIKQKRDLSTCTPAGMGSNGLQIRAA